MRLLQVFRKEKALRIAAQVAEEGHRQQHNEASGISRKQRLQRHQDVARTGALALLALEALAFGQRLAQRDDKHQGNQRECIQTAPSVRNDIDAGEGERRDSEADTTQAPRAGQSPIRERPASTSSDRMTSAIVPSAPAKMRASISHATKKWAVGEIAARPVKIVYATTV